MAVLINGTNGLIQAYDYQTPSTGFSYTFAAGTQTLVMNPAGTLATGTITMPPNPSDGMTITFSSTKQITALTLSGNTGQTIVGGITSMAPNQAVAFIYRSASTTWLPMTTQVAQATGPAFSAYLNTSQTPGAATLTKVRYDAEEFDTANCYDSTTNYRFTPNVAGYYYFTAAAQHGASFETIMSLYKNGSEIKRGGDYGSAWGSTVTGLIYCNGSTDYVEAYTYFQTSTAITTGATLSYFQGYLARAA